MQSLTTKTGDSGGESVRDGSPTGSGETVVIRGDPITTDEVVRVARCEAQVAVSDEADVVRRVQAACDYVAGVVERGEQLYGVTTGFGGMSGRPISPTDATELQTSLLWYHKAGVGALLPSSDVRAAMFVQANAHLQGRSGVRMEVIRRFELFLNQAVTPRVHEFGSIGASGDLVPLAYVAGALVGLDECFTVDFRGATLSAPEVLRRLGAPPLELRPKEGLALINGTSMMTGIAANVVHSTEVLLALTMGAHALFVQALRGTNQSFHPFIHRLKPHPGQGWAARCMLELLAGSALSRDELDGHRDDRGGELVQDRYSLRCLPQFVGPLADGLAQVARQVETELSSVTDNPLLDAAGQTSYYNGNFLGEYVGVSMDQLRYYVGLLAKHLDAQIALVVAPEFNNGLPPSLVANSARSVNMGLKGLQLAGNSIMPLLTFFGNSLADRFPTHAEQFNQNVNSQGFGSANLARQTVSMFQAYVAIALLFGVQAADLRTHQVAGHYDARACLSPKTAELYAAIRGVVGKQPSAERPYLWDDHDHALDTHVALLAADIAEDGLVPAAVSGVLAGMKELAH